jgi:predicted lipoprotein with Yx(FWY)xxD motif
MALVAIAASVLVASCTGSDSKPAAVTGTTVAPTTTTIPPPVVVTKVDPKLGEILADSAGLTLYTLTNNNIGVACDPTCAAIWPPLEVPPGGALPTGGVGVGLLGAAPGPNNILLVTSGALPLYRFTKDKVPADVNGEGVKSFGGTWHVVKVGSPTSSTAPSSTTTTAAPKTTVATEPDTTPDTTADTTPDTTPTTVTSPPPDSISPD